MNNIKTIKPITSIERKIQYDNSQAIARSLKQSVVEEGTILNCFATDTGDTTTSGTYVAPDTTAFATFVRCPEVAEGSDFVVTFRLSGKSVVMILATFGLYSDMINNNQTYGSLYVDSVQILPETTTFADIEEGHTLHYSTELNKGLHTSEVRFKVDGGVNTATLSNIRISIFSQELINK